MKTVTDLRDDLIEVYKETKSGGIDNQTAGVLANIAGKIVKSAALELNYNQFKKYSKREIKFFEG